MATYITRSLKSPTEPIDLSIKNFCKVNNKILILRQTGGVGDILMQRMMFEDIKIKYPSMKIVYSCPEKYKELVEDHPFMDEWIASEKVNWEDYLIGAKFNITTCCHRYEMKLAPLSDKNRSDIWANRMGMELSRHEMHINISNEIKNYAKELIQNLNKENKPKVIFCPISAMLGKNLKGKQITEVVDGLRERGFFVYSTHIKDIEEFKEKDVPVIKDISLKKWMGIINEADAAISVDSGPFHLAGGLKKPLVGVFAWTDGKVYGKYYKFNLIQKHRDDGWDCGPCYCWTSCPKERKDRRKPCISEITSETILASFDNLFKK